MVLKQKMIDLKKKYNEMTKENLKITIGMKTPIVIPDHPIHLDALLTHVIATELFPEEPDRWQIEDKHIDIPLPLEKYKGKTHTFWKASAAYCESPTKEYIDYWTKKTYSRYSENKVSGIVWPAGVLSNEPEKSIKKEIVVERKTGPANDPASGGFKSYYENRNILQAKSLIFHAVGNEKEIHRLCENIQYIGKKNSIGYGQVKDFTVEKTISDYSLFDPDGKPARVLPAIEFKNVRTKMIASPIKPPYWSNDREICLSTSMNIPIWKWNEAKIIIEEIDEGDYWFDD